MKSAIVATVLVVGAVAIALVLANGGVFGTLTPTPSSSPSSPRSPTLPTSSPSRRPSIPASPSTPRPSATPVETAVVADGVVVPTRSADLATPISGVVAATYVHAGSEAAANQLLLKLDQSTYQAAINTATADVTRATAAVAQAQLQVEQLPPEASPGQVDAAQATLRLAEADLDLARNLLSEAQTALLQTEVRAPFAGTVADVSVEVGEQAVAGQTVVILGDMTQWLIETTDLSELEVVRVAVGDRANVTFEALPGIILAGTVDRVQVRGTTDDGGVLFAVSIRPDTTDARLRWNMTATVRITPSG